MFNANFIMKLIRNKKKFTLTDNCVVNSYVECLQDIGEIKVVLFSCTKFVNVYGLRF